MKTNFITWLFKNKQGYIPLLFWIAVQAIFIIKWRVTIEYPWFHGIAWLCFTAIVFFVLRNRYREFLKEGGKNG